MDEKMKKILKIFAVTGIVAIGVVALINSEETKSMLRKVLNKFKEFPEGVDDPKAKLIFIAKQINRDIKNTQRKITKKAHERNQKKFENINWDEDSISRKDILKN